MSDRKIVTFPHMGDYWVVFKVVGELIGEVMLPPPMTARTLELGARYSPESACVPFKYTLGNFIEALDRGAEVIVQAGGGCRLGYYGEVQEEILKGLGYSFERMSLSNHTATARAIARDFKRLNPRNSLRGIMAALQVAEKKLRVLDAVQHVARSTAAFALDQKEHARVCADFLRALDAADTCEQIDVIGVVYAERIQALPQREHAGAVRVGIVGEVYVSIEPFANMWIERQLAERGVEVHRPVSVSQVLDDIFSWKSDTYKKMVSAASPYLSYDIGTDSTRSVAHAKQFMDAGFDGVIHVKPFGCMPEVNALPPLERLSRDNLFPIMYLSYDAQSAEAGVRTRIEAFCDVLEMRRSRVA
jgi:predicted nucleotide-binding protein (sugar kinase/HSP70/actin superfamily)